MLGVQVPQRPQLFKKKIVGDGGALPKKSARTFRSKRGKEKRKPAGSQEF